MKHLVIVEYNLDDNNDEYKIDYYLSDGTVWSLIILKNKNRRLRVKSENQQEREPNIVLRSPNDYLWLTDKQDQQKLNNGLVVTGKVKLIFKLSNKRIGYLITGPDEKIIKFKAKANERTITIA